MQAILDESGLAKKLGMQLEAVEYCDELATQLMQHAHSLDGYYKTLQKGLRADPPKSESWFQDTLEKVEGKFKWFEKAKAGGSLG